MDDNETTGLLYPRLILKHFSPFDWPTDLRFDWPDS